MTGDRTTGRGKIRRGRQRSDDRPVKRASLPERLTASWDAEDPEIAVLVERARDLVETCFPQVLLSGDGRFEGEQAQSFIGSLCSLPGPIQTRAVQELLDRDAAKTIALLEGLLDRGADLPEEVLDLTGERPGEDVARFLFRWHGLSKNKAFQKKLRSVLHKRKTRGLEVVDPDRTEDIEAVWRPPPVLAPEGFMSFPDGSGSRLVWVLRHFPTRRTLAVGGLIQDRGGLKQVSAQDLSRKETQLYRRAILEDKVLLVAATDPAYCAFRIDEAFRNAEPADPEQREVYLKIRPLLLELTRGAEPVHPASSIASGDEGTEEGPAVEDPLGMGAELPEGGLLDDWLLERDKIAPLADRYEEIQQSRIIVHPFQMRERISGFFREAVREYFTDPACQLLWRTRLLDAAWVLQAKGRGAEARKLCLAARNLSDPAGDPSKWPLLLHLMRKSLDAMLAAKKAAAGRTPSLIVKPGLEGR